MDSKKIKVIRSTRTRGKNTFYSSQSYIQTPKIQVEGLWLAELGFHVGDLLQVESAEGLIVIRALPKEPEPSMVAEAKPSYCTSRKSSKVTK